MGESPRETANFKALVCIFQRGFSRIKVMANKTGDYEADKQRLKEFLANFAVTDEEGKKTFKYAEQLTALAHREQTSLTIDLEDVAGVDEDLATAIRENTRRYNLLVAEVVEVIKVALLIRIWGRFYSWVSGGLSHQGLYPRVNSSVVKNGRTYHIISCLF